MPLFATISSFNMLLDSSKHCNLMLFLLSLKLLLFAILPCVLEHVLVISGDSSVFMFCHVVPVHHAHAFFMLRCCSMLFWCLQHACCCFGQIVAITCIECMCWTVALFWVCSIWNLLDFSYSFILSCCILVLRCLLDVCMHFASMPCLSCFAHIF